MLRLDNGRRLFEGIVPLQRESGKTHKVAHSRIFMPPFVPTSGLNTHRAYRGFRAMRETMRYRAIISIVWPDQIVAAYCAGDAYVEMLHSVIVGNDSLPLTGPGWGTVPSGGPDI